MRKMLLLLKFPLRGTTVNSHCNTRSSCSLNARLHHVHPTTDVSEVLLFHTSRQLCTCHVVLNSFHHTFACLFLGKTEYEDTMMWVTGCCITPCTNGHRGWRRWKKTADEAADYTLKYLCLLQCCSEVFTCLTCKQHEISNRKHCLHAREL